MTAVLPPHPGEPQVAPVVRLETRRQLTRRRPEDVFALVASGAAALSLAYLLYAFVLPFSGVLGFAVLAWVLFLGIYGLHTAMTCEGPLVKDRLAAAVVHGIGGLMLLALVVVVTFTFKRGSAALSHPNFFTQDLATSGPLQPLTQGGVTHAMLGTAIQITLALSFAIPVGIVSAIYLSESRSRFSKLVRTVVEAMTALPSIIAGLFVFAVILSIQSSRSSFAGLLRDLNLGQKGGLAAAMALFVMMLPIIIRAADVVLRLVPGTLKEAAAALGASRWRIAWQVVIPTSKSGLMTAIILGTARGIGETSPVLLTAGYTTGLNSDPTSGPMASLPLATFILTRSPEPTQIARGFGAAAVLMLMVLVLFVIARLIGGRAPGDLNKRQRRRAVRASQADAVRMSSAERPLPLSNGAPS